MRRLLALAALTAAALAPSTASAAAYYRTCGGAVDYQCSGRTCPTDCFTGDCLVWADPLHNSQLALCIGSPLDTAA